MSWEEAWEDLSLAQQLGLSWYRKPRCVLGQDKIRLSLPLVIEALIKRSYRFPRLSLAIIFSKLFPRKLKLSRQFVR